jgi:hypothetical protein
VVTAVAAAVVVATAVAVVTAVVEMPANGVPVPVAGKTAAMAPATTLVKLVVEMTTVAAVAVVAPPPVVVATIIPDMEVLRAEALRGRRHAIAVRPLPEP